MRVLGRTSERSKIEIYLVVLAIVLYLFRTAIPELKIPFFFIFFVLFIFTLIKYRIHLKTSFINFINCYRLSLLLAVVLLFSFLFSAKLYVEILKDILNIGVLFSLFFCSWLLVKGKEDLDAFYEALIQLIIIFAIIISTKFFCDLLEIRIFDSLISNARSSGPKDLQEIDISFGLLPLVFGIISVFYLCVRSKPVSIKILFTFLLIFFFVSILIMGSRRGIMFLGIFFFVLFFSILIPFLKSSEWTKIIARNSLLSVISLLLFFSILIFITNSTSYIFKNRVLAAVGSRDVTKAKTNIAKVITRYMLVFDNNFSYTHLYAKLFFTPKDPDSGWGTRVHKTIYPLQGKDSEIIPSETKGYYMDSTCNSDSRSGNAYSYTTVSSYYVRKNKILKASVFCYVSEDFDGTWAMLTSEGAVAGIKESVYKMESKGTWQKLELEVKSTGGISNFFLYFSKFGVNNFDNLKGYVIFAYPEVKEFSPADDSLLVSDNKTKTLTGSLGVSIETLNLNCESALLSKKYIMEGISEKGIKQDIIDTPKFSPQYMPVENNYCNYNYSYFLPIIIPFSSNNNNQDILKKWFYHTFTEDTIYHPYSKNLSVDTLSISFARGRLVRWEFAWQIYAKEFNLRQKIMGGGFNFLNWYGYYFLRDKTKSDWPHNPFISILLYSGIIGLILYLCLLYKVVYYYLKYLKEFYILFIFFLITFFFSFFSGGSPFDPPLIGFFTILPFFIHNIHKKLLTSS